MNNPTLPLPTRRLAAGLLFILLVAASTRLLVSSGWQGDLFTPRSPLFYQAGTLGMNYFELGWIRRGLGGSIVHLLSSDMLVGTVMFHLLSAAAVAAMVALFFAKLEAPWWQRGIFAFAALSIMLRWAEDAGRTDMLIAAVIALATWCLQGRRPLAAMACLCVGLFVHESSFIFGMPLMLALMLRQGGPATLPRRGLVLAFALLAATLALYAGMGRLPHADHQTIVDTVRGKFPPHLYVDWAIYFAISGMRGVQTAICQNLTDPSYWVHPTGGLVVLGVLFVALSWRPRREAWAAALVTLPPFLFLCFVANDTSRWTMFACFNLWLVSITTGPRTGRAAIPAWVSLIAVLAFLPLIHPKPNRIEYPIYVASPTIERMVRKLGGPRTPSLHEALRRCDPEWRSVLGKTEGR